MNYHLLAFAITVISKHSSITTTIIIIIILMIMIMMIKSMRSIKSMRPIIMYAFYRMTKNPLLITYEPPKRNLIKDNSFKGMSRVS